MSQAMLARKDERNEQTICLHTSKYVYKKAAAAQTARWADRLPAFYFMLRRQNFASLLAACYFFIIFDSFCSLKWR